MLDINFIRQNLAVVERNIQKRKELEKLKILEQAMKLDEEWREAKGKLDGLRHKRNELSLEINRLMKAGKKKECQELIKEAQELPEKISKKEARLAKIQMERDELLRQLPNIMHPDVPYGKDSSENPVIKKWGMPRKFDFSVKNHVELAESLGIADFEASARTTGNGFYFIRDELALLNQALIRFTVDHMHRKGYHYVEPPLIVKKRVLDAAMDATAFQQSIYTVGEYDPDGKVKEKLSKDPSEQLCLIGTSEHAILGMLDNQLLDESQLPLKVFSYSMCFRQEIGSHGINEKGLWRTHQFNKVEQFIFCREEETWDMYFELMKNSEELLQALGLPYRIIEICTGDLALWKARSADLEVYRPTTHEYGEVMSLSNCTTFQSQGLNIKYISRARDTESGEIGKGSTEGKAEKKLVHTLNNTAMATSRILVAILENYQNADGSVTVPPVLVPYMQGISVIRKK